MSDDQQTATKSTEVKSGYGWGGWASELFSRNPWASLKGLFNGRQWGEPEVAKKIDVQQSNSDDAKKTKDASEAAGKPIQPTMGAKVGANTAEILTGVVTIPAELVKHIAPNSLPGKAASGVISTVRTVGGAIGSDIQKAGSNLTGTNYAVIEQQQNGKINSFLIPVDGDGKPSKNSEIHIIEGKTADQVFTNHKSYEKSFGANIINLPITQRFKDLYAEFKAGGDCMGDGAGELPAAMNAATQTNAGIIALGLAISTAGSAAAGMLGSVARLVPQYGRLLSAVVNLAAKGYTVLGGLGFIAYGVYCGITEPKGFFGTTANSQELTTALEKSDKYKEFCQNQGPAKTLQDVYPGLSQNLDDLLNNPKPAPASATKAIPAVDQAMLDKTAAARSAGDGQTQTAQAANYLAKFSPSALPKADQVKAQAAPAAPLQASR